MAVIDCGPMATPARLAANRQNALLSTGPRTPEGKAVACQNARTHGLLSRQVLLPDDVRAEMLLSLGGGGEGLSACANVGTSVREIIRRSQPMAGRLVMGGPPTQPGNVVRLEVFPPAVGPGLGQRPLERPAVDRVPHQRRHDAGSSPPILAVDVNGPVATIADEREKLLGVVVRR